MSPYLNSLPLSSLLSAIFVLGLIAFSYRYILLSSLGQKFVARMPEEFLRLLGPASFAAIVGNNLFGSHQDPKIFKYKIFVLLVSSIVAARTKSTLLTLALGLALLYFLPKIF